MTDYFHLRRKHPGRVPVKIFLNRDTEPTLKLLLPSGCNMSDVLMASRAQLQKKGHKKYANPNKGLFLMHGNKMPCNTTTLVRYDTERNAAIHFRLLEENTFGA